MFIKSLTDEGDSVLDPFAVSNTTWQVAEYLGRKWIAIEKNEEYACDSQLRFAEVTPEPTNGTLKQASLS